MVIPITKPSISFTMKINSSLQAWFYVIVSCFYMAMIFNKVRQRHDRKMKRLR